MLQPQQTTSKTEHMGGEDEVCTTNIYVFTACLAEGGVPQPKKFDRTDPRRVKLVVRGVGLKKVVDDWWSGESPYRRYAEKLRDAKEWIRPVEVRQGASV